MVVEILGEMLKVCQASLGFLNLIADYTERRLDLGHDEDCLLLAGKHSWGATLALLFTHSRCPIAMETRLKNERSKFVCCA
jgi:hypothetical protein